MSQGDDEDEDAAVIVSVQGTRVRNEDDTRTQPRMLVMQAYIA
jgi:hypothetical protein